ncbi:MAG: DotU family type IV/VI secretion system protein [Deltaproteobacteria bacterium]|jgi:hypothetical protein|nr:DotU family type IV/VI secretion system protein [Deltaproteobacteria bacterium]
MRFAERFFQVYYYGLMVETTPEADWERVASQAEELLEREAKLSLPPGFSSSDREEALKPVLLWLDERFQTWSRDDARVEVDQWPARSFQRRYYGSNLGGELFFEGLRDLLERRASSMPIPVPGPGLADLWTLPGTGRDPLEGLLDCYALSLVLGYQGRYYQGDVELLALRELAKTQLAAWRENVEPSRAPTRLARLKRSIQRGWRDYGWVLGRVLWPLGLLTWLWVRRGAIIDSLPF